MPITPSVRPPAACPRCHGRLATSQDWAGTYSSCFLCGYVYEWGVLPATVIAAEAATEGERPVVGRRVRGPSHRLHQL